MNHFVSFLKKTLFQAALKFLACVNLLLLFSTSLFAGNYTWNGTINSDYSNTGNWSPSGTPGTNDTITINGKTITFQTGAGALAGSGNAYTLGIGNDLSTLASALDTLQGNTGGGSVASTVTGGQIQLNSGVAATESATATAGCGW